MALCRHCNKSTATRPRGLCWSCHNNQAVRAMYPSTSKFASRGFGVSNDARPLPEPTDVMPGTPDKVAVLRSRAESGQQLFHEADPSLFDDATDDVVRSVAVSAGSHHGIGLGQRGPVDESGGRRVKFHSPSARARKCRRW